jgi:DNA-binding response OmpR family regulator
MTDRVLIVDDSVTVRMDLAQAFEGAAFEVQLCASAAEARAAFARGSAAVVVLDVLLPDGDGVDLLKELRAAQAGQPLVILMLSTEAEVKDRLRGLRTGADDYVGKPYDAGYVVAKARQLLRAQRVGTSPGARTTVLLIDDSVTFREALRSALHDGGYEVVVAGSGEEGLQLAASQRPAGIVVDGVLPGIDGPTVIRRIRLDAALRDVPCVLLTGSGDHHSELRALDAGADAFVRKEEDIEVILARIAAALRRGTAAPSSSDTTSVLGPKKILAIDDSATYLSELATVLREERYDVVLAHGGEEALELLSVEPVDCILLDLLMPGIGGQETCRRIKSAPVVREIPLIMMTALDDRNAMLENLSAGADDYISKSSDFEVLKARVRAQLRRKQFEDENRRIREELLEREIEAREAKAARELAEVRAALVEELESKNQQLEAFSYSVSHDLRAPLRSIDGFGLALLEDHAAQLDAAGQNCVRRIRTGTARMAALIEDMLSLSRVSRADLRRERIDLAEIARAVVADLRRAAPERSVDVILPAVILVNADGNLMRIALGNLLGNAWKFTSKVEAARIELLVTEQPSGAVYVVRDNGAGFDMASAGKLFRPFQRLHREVDFEGTGIGLATVQRVIDRHGGRVWAEGVVGAGASVSFTLGKRAGEH